QEDAARPSAFVIGGNNRVLVFLYFIVPVKNGQNGQLLFFAKKSVCYLPATVPSVSASYSGRDIRPAHTVHIAQKKDQPHLCILYRVNLSANRVILGLQLVHALP